MQVREGVKASLMNLLRRSILSIHPTCVPPVSVGGGGVSGSAAVIAACVRCTIAGSFSTSQRQSAQVPAFPLSLVEKVPAVSSVVPGGECRGLAHAEPRRYSG